MIEPEPVVVESGEGVDELGVIEEVPVALAGATDAEVGRENGDGPEGVIAVALGDVAICVDDSGRVEIVLEHEAEFINGAGDRTLAADEIPSVGGVPNILDLDRSGHPLLDGAP